jgi:flagellin-specific chaperone FliS
VTNINAYTKEVSIGGWTRIEMLLAIYDRAIDSLSNASDALAEEECSNYNQNMMSAQKAILAIHAGLQPDKDEVAFNIARLLHFVLSCIENEEFDDAIKVLKNMRSGFAAVHEEANLLEANGMIPPVQQADAFEASA